MSDLCKKRKKKSLKKNIKYYTNHLLLGFLDLGLKNWNFLSYEF